MDRIRDLPPRHDVLLVPNARRVLATPCYNQRRWVIASSSIHESTINHDVPLLGDQRPLADDEPRATRRALLVVLEVRLVGYVRGHGAVTRQRGHHDAVLELDGAAAAELEGGEERCEVGGHAARVSAR